MLGAAAQPPHLRQDSAKQEHPQGWHALGLVQPAASVAADVPCFFPREGLSPSPPHTCCVPDTLTECGTGPTGSLHEEGQTAEHQRKAAGKPWCHLAAYITRFPARCRPQITSMKCQGVKCSNSRLAATPALEGFKRSCGTLKLRCNTTSYKMKQTLLIPRAQPIAAAPHRTEAHAGVNSCS